MTGNFIPRYNGGMLFLMRLRDIWNRVRVLVGPTLRKPGRMPLSLPRSGKTLTDAARRLAQGKRGADHYGHMTEHVTAFFEKRGIDVLVEAHGSRGPDIESVQKDMFGRPRLVGEIKHARELERDLPGKFWSDWNNGNLSFGGKRKGEALRDMEKLPPDVDNLSSCARGFVATVLGQLQHYARTAGLSEGWLVLENASR